MFADAFEVRMPVTPWREMAGGGGGGGGAVQTLTSVDEVVKDAGFVKDMLCKVGTSATTIVCAPVLKYTVEEGSVMSVGPRFSCR